jgi:hypothetical protein
MAQKNVFTAIAVMMLLAWSGLALADEYRPDEFLGLDLSKAVLSSKPLGPPSRFAPAEVEAKTDPASEARPVRVERIERLKVRLAHRDKEKRRDIARTKLAHSHRSPLDSQAFDARVQVWPCRSGGICNWKPQAN